MPRIAAHKPFSRRGASVHSRDFLVSLKLVHAKQRYPVLSTREVGHPAQAEICRAARTMVASRSYREVYWGHRRIARLGGQITSQRFIMGDDTISMDGNERDDLWLVETRYGLSYAIPPASE